MALKNRIHSVLNFYVRGFREMTWGRELWGLIILKLVLLFLVLRVFFFTPILAGKTKQEKSDFVGDRLIEQFAQDPASTTESPPTTIN